MSYNGIVITLWPCSVWMLYQELWGSLGGHYVPPLHVKSMKEICQDLLNLMIGVPSHSFLWSTVSYHKEFHFCQMLSISIIRSILKKDVEPDKT